MMTETRCSYPDRDEHLVAFLYDDIDAAERTSFGSASLGLPILPGGSVGASAASARR